MKYKKSFKLKVVKEFLEKNVTYKELADKYNMPAHSVVKNWVDKYNLYGVEGLEKRNTKHKHDYNFKLQVVQYYLTNNHTQQEVADKFGLSNASTVYEWTNKYNKYGVIGLKPEGSRLYMNEKKKNRKHEKVRRRKYSYDEYHELLERLKEKEAEVEFLKVWRRLNENQINNLNKAKIVHDLHKNYKLKYLLAAAKMSKSTYEYNVKKISNEKTIIDEEKLICKISKDNPTWGYRRVHGFIRTHHYLLINIKKVHRIRKKFHLQVQCFTRKKRNFSTYKGTVGKIAPNILNREFNAEIPHQKVVTDTSEFKYYSISNKGKLNIKKAYLDPFLDLYNTEVIAFSFAPNHKGENIIKALKKTTKITEDCPKNRLFHGDQGSLYQMKIYQNILKENNITQSMSRKGNCHDNAVMESFFGTMKQEMYYDYVFYSFEELKSAVTKYIYYYNNHRIKEKLGWKAPIEYRIEKQKSNIRNAA